MIEIKFSFNTVAEAAAFLARANGETTQTVLRDTPSGTVRPKPAQEAKPAPEPKAEQKPAEAPAEAPAQAQAAPPAEQKAKAPDLSYKDVQAAVMALTAIGASDGDQGAGRVAAKKVCAGMGIGTFKEIQNSPALWQKAIEQLNAARVALQG